MKGFLILFSVPALILSSPLIEGDNGVSLDTRQTASGCYHHASPTCCLPGVCMCKNGWIYEVNRDQMNAGGHGCDPPWGFIATSRRGYPGYCC